MNTPPPHFVRPAPPQHVDPCEGILLVDKPAGPTSHDIVAQVRRAFRIQKVGHGGTLDPQATGLLVLLLGRATKLSNRFLGSDKTYEGAMRFGISTDSQDAQGRVIAEAPADGVTEDRLRAGMKGLLGDSYQTPPMVSAIKIAGVPLYKLARKGETVERTPRVIHIYEFELLGFNPPDADFRVTCTKGAYVRTLCSDLGDSLGCGAHLIRLRRTVSGSLRIEDAATLDTVLSWDRETLARHVLPMHRFV